MNSVCYLNSTKHDALIARSHRIYLIPKVQSKQARKDRTRSLPDLSKCEKHARKEEAVAALNAGRKFDDVARELSEDKARQGGSLGWKAKGSLLPELEKVAFELETSTVGAPKWREVKTSEGYHLVMVEGKK